MKIDELLLRDCNFNKNIIYVITDKNIIDLGKCLKNHKLLRKLMALTYCYQMVFKA